MQSVCYLTIITSPHPRSLVLFVYQSPCARQLPLGATTTLPGHQDPRTGSDNAHFLVRCLKNVLSFWVLCLVRLLLSLPFLEVSTERADNFIGLVAYALSNRPRRITRRYSYTGKQKMNFFALVAATLPMPLFRHSQTYLR